MFQFDILKPYSDKIEHGVTPDLFGILADQVHGDEVMEIVAKPEGLPKCDAFITMQSDLPLMVKVADCQGILIYDPVTHSAAAVHSGWRGSTLNIIGKAIREMEKSFVVDPKNLRVGISPSLGPCCAEFSDPKNELPEFCHEFIGDNNHIDFWSMSVKQCQNAGIPENQIELAGKCTKCQPGYLSHRNGDSGRMGVFVTLL